MADIPNSLASTSPRLNHLLAALPETDYQRILSNLVLTDLPYGKSLYESGISIRDVYFPTTAIVSLLFNLENGSSTEIAICGNESVVGIAVFMGGESVPNRAVVQSAGLAYRLGGQILNEEFSRSGPFQHLLMRYSLALFSQMTQTAVCNRHHSLDQQLCRWLLLSFDRLPGNELYMTQELISNILGMQGDGIIEAIGKLQDAGLIRYNHGQITMLDRSGLEARVCECYEVVKKEFRRLLPDVIAD
jgi:CRP-like cAMP-binding protein